MKDNKLIPLFGCLLFGIILWFLPHPAQLTDQAWHVFVLFVTTILSIVIKPLPMESITIIAAAIGLVTNSFTSKQVFSAFGSDVIWLVVFALFIAKGFNVTGLGNRLAYVFTKFMGKSTLGLSYGLMATDLIMAPAVPSVTGRAVGIVYPILRTIAENFGSYPNSDSAKRVGGFLTVTAFQITVITSTMFMTAMAANPFIAKLLIDEGFDMSWSKWAIGAVVPGVICLLAIPLILYKIYKPELTQTPQAPAMARQKLAEMGPMRWQEWLMAGTIVLLLGLWIFGEPYGISAASAALMGLSILLLSGVLKWSDLVSIHTAWETFVWFALLLMMASALKDSGFISWFSQTLNVLCSGLHWSIGFPLVAITYFYSHYLFASATAHVASMYMPFLAISLALGTPPWLAIMILSYFSNLFGGLTHYSLSPAPILYGVGYVDIKDWWKLGFIISIFTLSVFVGIGSVWWKFLGWW